MLKPEKFDIDTTDQWHYWEYVMPSFNCVYCSAIHALPDCFYNFFVVPFNKKH